MIALAMAEERSVELDHPNREKAASKATRWIVVLLLVVSCVLMTIVAVGGWEALEGANGVLVAWILVYAVIAFYVARWNRGVLPLAGALAVLLLIFAFVAGPQWLERDADGYVDPALPSEVLGFVTLLLIPVQVLLVAFVARGFGQDWHVEVERPAGRRHDVATA